MGTEEIAAHYRQRILSGELTFGARLPAMSTMQAEWGVSRGVVKAAMDQLEREGLAINPGTGNVVILPPEAVARPSDLVEAARWLVAMGYPFDWHGARNAPTAPPALREAVIDAIHEDQDGQLHGNTLDREQVVDRLNLEAPGFAPTKGN